MKTLVYQIAHYPRKTGATGAPGEQEMSLRVGKNVRDTAPAGWTVRLINADTFDANYKGDAFVALHGDGSSDKSLRGASVGYQSDAGMRLAHRWKAAYDKVFPSYFRADNYTANLAGYYGVRIANEQGNHRAFIAEVGFLTNPIERAWIDTHTAAIARSIWDAIEPATRYRVIRTHGARWLPGWASPIRFRVAAGDRLTAVQGTRGGWKKVRNSKGKTGWVYRSYTREV